MKRVRAVFVSTAFCLGPGGQSFDDSNDGTRIAFSWTSEGSIRESLLALLARASQLFQRLTKAKEIFPRKGETPSGE